MSFHVDKNIKIPYSYNKFTPKKYIMESVRNSIQTIDSDIANLIIMKQNISDDDKDFCLHGFKI